MVYLLKKGEIFMKKGIIIVLFIAIIGVSFNYFTKETYSKDLMISFDELVENYDSDERLEFDFNKDNIVDIYDLAKGALDLRIIEIDDLTRNYVEIVSSKEKQQYKENGYDILSAKAFPITADGVDLFEYVNAARGMALEILEGDNCFEVINDKIYLTGQAPAIAKVRLVSNYGTSDEFYIYGTSDREVHNYTYDFIMNSLDN